MIHIGAFLRIVKDFILLYLKNYLVQTHYLLINYYGCYGLSRSIKIIKGTSVPFFIIAVQGNDSFLIASLPKALLTLKLFFLFFYNHLGFGLRKVYAYSLQVPE